MHCSKCSVPVLAALLVCSLSADTQIRRARSPRPLRTVAALAGRRLHEASLSTVVRLRAQIAFVDPEWRLLFIHDATGSGFIQLPPKTKMSPLRAGDLIQMTGSISGNDANPTILHPNIRVIARRPLATPRALSLAEIEAGHANGQYVLTEGVIRPGPVVENHTWLTLVDKDNATSIIIPGARTRSALALVGAHVVVRGISAVRRDETKRAIRPELFVQSFDDVLPERSNRHDLFGSAVVSISRIRDSSIAAPFIAPYHGRAMVLRKGTNGFVIADASGSVEMRASEASILVRGSEAEVIGLPQLDFVAVSLEDARIPMLGSASSPLTDFQSASAAQVLRYRRGDSPQMWGQVISEVRGGADNRSFSADGRKQFEVSLPVVQQDLPDLAAAPIVEASDTLRHIGHPDAHPAKIQFLPNLPTESAVHTKSVDWRVMLGMLIGVSIASALLFNKQIDDGLQAAIALLAARRTREGHENRYRRQVERNLEAVFSWRPPGDIRDRDRNAVDILCSQPVEHVIVGRSCADASNRPQIHWQIHWTRSVHAGATNEFRTSRTAFQTGGDHQHSSTRSERHLAEIPITGWEATARQSRPATDHVRKAGYVDGCNSIAATP